MKTPFILLLLPALVGVVLASPCNVDPPFFTFRTLTMLPPATQNQLILYFTHSQSLLSAERTQSNTEANGAEPTEAPGGKDFKIQSDWKGDWFKTPEAAQLAQVIMSFQTSSGGWLKAVDYTKGTRAKGMAWAPQWKSFLYGSAEQLVFLNEYFAATGDKAARSSTERGLDYIFAAQYPNGGWPQAFPLIGRYHDAITFSDATNGTLELLRSIADNSPQWQWLDVDRRTKASASLANGTACILASQFRQNGQKTAWCAQEDPLALYPVAAAFKPSLSGRESVRLVHFLMGIPHPSPQVIASINGALDWFEKVKITSADGSVKWARFYDLQTNTPLFAGSEDGTIFSTSEAIVAQNRVSDDYFLTTPQELLEEVPQWRQSLVNNP